MRNGFLCRASLDVLAEATAHDNPALKIIELARKVRIVLWKI